MVDGLLDWMEDNGAALKLALLLFLAASVSLVAFQFVVAPQQQRAQALQQALRELDRRLVDLDGPGDVLERLNDEMDVLAPQVEAQKKVLGIHMPMDHLLSDIVETAQTVGVTLTSWQPEVPMLIPDVRVHQVILRLNAEGRYHTLARFLEGLQSLPKALMVRSMEYRIRTEDAGSDIQASFELVGFQALARSEQQALARAAVKG